MDYFIERMDTLSQRTKRRPVVIAVSANLKTIRSIAAQNKVPALSEVQQLRVLADEAMKAALQHEEMPATTGDKLQEKGDKKNLLTAVK